ncbi:UNVERIFIED_CONTAM: hypothetical protein NCL1_09285 [Trichonephila clavipes]
MKEFGTVIEDDYDTNVDSEKELSHEQKLDLVITKKISINQSIIQKSAISKTIRREIDLFEDGGFRDCPKPQMSSDFYAETDNETPVKNITFSNSLYCLQTGNIPHAAGF